MSFKASGRVWEMDLEPSEAWVLMAYADHADHDGKNIFPGVRLIAWKTNLGERQIIRITKSLVDKHILVEDDENYGKQGAKKYHIDWDIAPMKSAPKTTRRGRPKGSKTAQTTKTGDNLSGDILSGDILSGDKLSPHLNKTGDICDTHLNKTGDNLSKTGDIATRKVVINRHEPINKTLNRQLIYSAAEKNEASVTPAGVDSNTLATAATKFDFPELWRLVDSQSGFVRAAWDFNKEGRAVKNILAKSRDSTPQELAAFRAYVDTIYRPDPTEQGTFSKYQSRFEGWRAAGRPTSAEEGKQNGQAGTSNSRGREPLDDNLRRRVSEIAARRQSSGY